MPKTPSKKMKKCYKCKKEKDLSQFYRDRTRRDGFQPRCKKCDNEHAVEQRKKYPTRNYRKAQRYIDRYPERQKARLLVREAIARGELKRGSCRDCGSKKVHAHHPDWSKPLKVVWLCPLHHKQEHELC